MITITVILQTMRTKFFKEAIDSVLNQSFKDFEVIMIIEPNNNPPIPNDPRIRIIHNREHLGIARGRNLGIKLAKGKYIVIHDDDDVSFSERFKMQVAYLDNHPSIAGVGSYFQVIDYDSNPRHIERTLPLHHTDILEHMHINNCLVSGSMMIRRNLFAKVGNFNDHYLFSEDYEYWSRAISKGFKFENLPIVLFQYRFYPNQTSKRYLPVQIACSERIRVKYDNGYFDKICQKAKIDIRNTHQRIHRPMIIYDKIYRWHIWAKEKCRRLHILRVARFLWRRRKAFRLGIRRILKTLHLHKLARRIWRKVVY